MNVKAKKSDEEKWEKQNPRVNFLLLWTREKRNTWGKLGECNFNFSHAYIARSTQFLLVLSYFNNPSPLHVYWLLPTKVLHCWVIFYLIFDIKEYIVKKKLFSLLESSVFDKYFQKGSLIGKKCLFLDQLQSSNFLLCQNNLLKLYDETLTIVGEFEPSLKPVLEQKV